jgi:glucose-6-phosphate isomerase
MVQFGLDPSRSFKIWDWVGGRFSLWSAIGLSIAISTSPSIFVELLEGANAMDRHFQTAPAAANIPVLLGLIAVWNQNFGGITDHVILPYHQRLAAFPAYVQQLEMESNGKSTRRDGQPVDYSTAVSVWGSVGANAQHSFGQLLHQGTQRISVDFIAAVRDEEGHENQTLQTLSHMLAQADALAIGQSPQQVQSGLEERGVARPDAQSLLPHLVHPGNRPSTILLLRELNARSLGMLIALYEHKVFVESVIWGINAFDQWGVELGKHLAESYAGALLGRRKKDQITDVALYIQKSREK